MKILLVSTGQTLQDQDLIQTTQGKNLSLEIISYPFDQTFNPQKEFKKLSQYDLIYWRIGNLKLRNQICKLCLKNKIPFINSVYAYFPKIARKSFQEEKVRQEGLKTPKTIEVKKLDQDHFNQLKSQLRLPFILKPNIGHQGTDVYLIKTFSDLPHLPNSPTFLAQEFLPNTGDYRVIAIGHQAIGLYKRVPKKGEIRANISVGGHGEKVKDKKLSSQLFHLAEKASQILKLEIAGFDFILSKNSLYFIEANTIPQWQGFQKTTGINVASKIISFFLNSYQ